MFHRTHLVAAALAVAVSPVLAQGPSAKWLPADTAFVAHVDLQRLGDLIGIEQLLKDQAGDDAEELDQVLRQMERRWGFNPMRDLVSATVFGREIPGEDPNVIIVTTDAIDSAVEKLEDAGAIRAERRNGVDYYRIYAAAAVAELGLDDVEPDGDESAVFYLKRVDRNRRALLVGEDVGDIADTARVLDGVEASLAEARRPQLDLRPSRSAIIYVELSASFEDLMKRTPASKLASKVRRLAFELSEEQGTIGMEIVVTTETPKDAEDMAAVVNGLRGMVSLASMSEEIPDFAREAIMSARAESRGERFSLSLSVPVEDLRALIDDEMGGRRRRYREGRDDEEERPRRRRRREYR